MSSAATWSELAALLGSPLTEAPRALGGGCISESYRCQTDHGPVFVKIGPASALAMFEAEAAGLRELRAAEALRVPEVFVVSPVGSQASLVLEWIDFGAATRQSEWQLGEQLASQHRVTAPAFGWGRDNAIGATPQPNTWCADWIEFYRERRLRHQLRLAGSRGADRRFIERGERLLEVFDSFFTSYRPVPSLLHGDLWGGNWAVDSAGRPVVFDPAVYYGDRETDIAMTRLFGGFGAAFYTSYQASWPLDQAAGTRRTLYNLYHVLNHYNLFGSGYLEQARSMIEHLLAELGL